jgi:hypothetical protein
MPRNFYYGKDADVVTGSANFAALILSAPVSYGLVAAQATSYGTVNTALQGAYTAAISPDTRTPVAIEAKTTAMKNVQRNAMLLSKIIYATPTVTNAQLVALGLLARTVPTPRLVPSVPPVLEVVSVFGRVVKVRIHSGSSESRAKPFGAIAANLYSYVGPAAPTDPTAYHYEGMATRATTDILFPNTVASGATVWLSAQWVSARGQLSVGSVPISVTIQGGAIPAAA